MFAYYSKVLMKGAQKRKIIFLCVVFLVMCLICIVTILNLKTSAHGPLYVHASDNISCYTTREHDSLPIIDGLFSPPVKSIHFHETSCNNGLNTRQACAVESAAIAHPGWQINVFFAGPVTKGKLNVGSMKVLTQYENIKLLRINTVDYALGTPLESLVGSGALNRSRWKIYHTSDALRYISLYKWGGVYLDLDMVVARSFEELTSNWAARESDNAVGAGVLAFSNDKLGSIVAETAIRDFENNYRGDLWGHNGPKVITRVLRKMCDTEKYTDMSAGTCKGFEVYGPELFYPVSLEKAKEYFDTKELDVGEPYTYHIWNKDTKELRVGKESAYAKLAQKYCPKVYRTYGDDFGL